MFGDVTDVAAVSGSGDTVHLALRHAGGAASTATLSLTAPEPAAGVTVELRGERGVFTLPELGEGAVEALRHAIDALITAARTGQPHPCDARFALRVTETLASVEEALGKR